MKQMDSPASHKRITSEAILLVAISAWSQADLSKRYGCLAGGANDIKTHPFFKGVDWVRVARRDDTPPIRCMSAPAQSAFLSAPAPYIPYEADNDVSH